jgi:alkanesulfonate monooxygenase SsuD/methylene tetrahydromethanopterin reductase-like flavin-dependent oxidoreductase (luciferase family)
MLTVSVVVAPTDDEAERIALPAALSFLRLRQGQPGPLPSPETAAAHPWSDLERDFARQRREGQAVGSPETVQRVLDQLLTATQADELMVTAQLHSPEDRLRSLELTRDLFADLPRGLSAAQFAPT